MPRKLFAVFFSTLVAFAALAQQAPGRGRPTRPAPPPPPPPAVTATAGDAIGGLTASEAATFAAGLEEFSGVEGIDDGLGPVFNGRSCGECHDTPVVGGGSSLHLVTRVGRRVNGTFDPLTNLGGSLLQDHALGPEDGSTHQFRAETAPALATIVVHRRTTPLFGLGLIDATPDSDFIALAQQQRARNDGTAGRAPLVDNIRAGMKTVGKFGWKGQVPTLLQFAGDAYLNEMGITNPLFPNENCPNGDCSELAFNPMPGMNDGEDGIRSLADYTSMLAPPPRAANTRDTSDGEATFERIGCTSCHVATMHSGTSSVAALSGQTYHPYSDFLLHDVGSLGDGIEQGDANGREIRTAPLWGLRFLTTYLHDGRATTLEGAITAHEGQARAARDRYNALNRNEKDKLLTFLRSL
ncbi:MAG: hypothetical protein QOI24_3879 [Acidobacteriota bacterium]|jgi:CxxC motif-containing protein (DUF1111 family)|nr:hypothetical protein [Acidobacteriota bacterium]